VAAVGLFAALRVAWYGAALDRQALALALVCSAVLTVRRDLHGASLLAGAATTFLGLAATSRRSATTVDS